MTITFSLTNYRRAGLAIACILISATAFAQVDTVYSNNQKIACVVKEITPDAVKYTYPGEDVVNSVYKNAVQKIVFKSGRVQTFAEATSYKKVINPSDFENVTITAVEGEVRGLYKLGDVGAKAKGTTVLSNQERVKDRAYRKMKIQAAMLGANIVYLTAQRTEGNKWGTEYTAGSTTETNLTGVAYSNQLPDLEQFKKLIGSRTQFPIGYRYKLGASDSDLGIDELNKNFNIVSVNADNGIVKVTGFVDGENNDTVYQLAGFSDKGFNVAYKKGATAYNIEVRL
ncbi:hypothetical protein MUY27_14735 [Mucilaginibacter sp. RS28]|uniref:Uncharacterized protein n=1 Tax=Mucilaginibacter straminoryzae TaxID=2932774 RepID=A0A9X1X4I7_9SPHI|nr:hypothetical protein [Mucilaginibacter straminoryzae]MCJ8210972.1 hypothetical protein [Mucilaginibacter straminoryzae]